MEEEKIVNPEEGSNVQGKKAKMQSGRNMAGPTLPHDDDGDEEYNFKVMGAKVTPAVPHFYQPCSLCIRH